MHINQIFIPFWTYFVYLQRMIKEYVLHFLIQPEEENGYTLNFKCKIFGVSEPYFKKRKEIKGKGFGYFSNTYVSNILEKI